MAWIADALTASRIGLAVLLGAAVASDRFDLAVFIVVLAWLTDSLDGVIARAASGPTRLGDWDFRIDMGVCIAILTGLAASGRAPIWLIAVIVLVGMGFTPVTGNPAPAMLFMGVAYAWFLAILYVERPEAWWLPFALIPVLLALDWRRFRAVILPAFFKGAARVGRSDATESPPVLDDWA